MNSVKWACPDPAIPDADVFAIAQEVYERISNIRSNFFHRARFCGFELEMSLYLLSSPGRFNEPDNVFWHRKCHTLILRPAIEPILYAFYEKIRDLEMSKEDARRIASLCSAESLIYREKSIVGNSEERRVEFEAFEKSKSWMDDIRTVSTDRRLRLLAPAYIYARTIMAHPFNNGNGRFSRLMVHGALFREGIVSTPCVPLAPFFYAKATTMGNVLNNLSEAGDWSAYYRTFFSILDRAAEVAEKYLHRA